MPGHQLYNWGVITFEVWPFNVHSVQHSTATDWARKEIAGAAIYREWVGELDEEIHFRGRVFPRFFSREARLRATSGRSYPVRQIGQDTWTAAAPEAYASSSGGLGHLDVMDAMRRMGQAHALVRGDGWHLGWFVIERLQRGHEHLDQWGIGQQIDFEATMQRVPVPVDPASYFQGIWEAPK